ncbi:hypothetical protein C3L33_14489, partial [Rhododendron williamsianum]
MRLLQLAFIVALTSGLAAIYIYTTGVSDFYGPHQVSDEDLEAFRSLQRGFQKCVVSFPLRNFSSNGLGLQAVSGTDFCEIVLQFPSNTDSKWVVQCLKQRDPKTGEPEGLSFSYNLCEALATWEQVRNSTTVLTKEFIDALPNGWEDYAWRRINKGILLNRCENKTLCMEKLSLVLPEKPPYFPRQFGRCAVVGNSGDLLKTKFGKEIDGYSAVFRENGAPIQNYTDYVGSKSTFRLLNRGSAKALDKVAELYGRRVTPLVLRPFYFSMLIICILQTLGRSTGDIQMGYAEIPIQNPVYLMLGASFGSAAKGTGLKALEFALSICDTVDMYGFTVDPGYKEWTRYFSESRQGHTPLQGRAYYQMMECLGVSLRFLYSLMSKLVSQSKFKTFNAGGKTSGNTFTQHELSVVQPAPTAVSDILLLFFLLLFKLIKIHSPMRSDPNRVVKWLPDRGTVAAARIASEKLLRRVGAGSGGPLGACSIIKKLVKGKHKGVSGLRKAAVEHQKYVKETTMYPLEHDYRHGLLCTKPTG